MLILIISIVRSSSLYTARSTSARHLTAIVERVTNYNKLISTCLIATHLHVLLVGLQQMDRLLVDIISQITGFSYCASRPRRGDSRKTTFIVVKGGMDAVAANNTCVIQKIAKFVSFSSFLVAQARN